MKTTLELTETLLGGLDLQHTIYSNSWVDLWDETTSIDAGSLSIVWDPDVPLSHGTMIVDQHLTPLDWILALSIRRLKGDPRSAWIDTSAVNIIDVGTNLDRTSFSDTVVASLLGQMPWVRVFAPFSLGRAGYQDLLKFDVNGNAILNRRLNGALEDWEQLGNNQHRLSGLRRLNRAWQTWIESSQDHHDLNNLLGAELLSGMTKSAASRSLLHRLQWSGLGGSAPSVEPISLPETSCDIVVVDDQASPGWGSLFEKLLERTAQAELKTVQDPGLFLMTSPYQLLRALKLDRLVLGFLSRAAQVGTEPDLEMVAHYGRRVFDAPHWTSEETGRRPWVLVLDLRFFIAKDREEEEWYRALACATLQVFKSQGLAWTAFGSSERSLLGKMANWEALDWLSDEAVALKLSLLPCLCAWRWPMVPIVLFSNTRNRLLIDRLSNCSNIFISAPKPNIIGVNALAEVQEFGLKFQRELLGSNGLLRLQQVILDCKRSLLQIGQRKPLFSAESTTYYQLVAAFDEAGDFRDDKYSAVAAIVLVAPGDSPDTAAANAAAFQERIRAAGIHFFAEAPYYHEIARPGAVVRKEVQNKRTSVSHNLEQAIREHRSTNAIWLAGVCLVVPKLTLSEHIYQDGTYLRTLHQLVNILLCEWLTCAGLDDYSRMRLSLWFPDKQTSYESTPHQSSDQLASEAARRLDFRRTSATIPMTEAIGGHGSAYLTIQSALAGRSQTVVTEIFRSISLLRARKIPYGNSTPHFFWRPASRLVREYPYGKTNPGSGEYAEYCPIAHLADSALTGVSKKPKEFPSDWAFGSRNISGEASFCITSDDMLADFLEVSRQIDSGELNLLTEALKTAYRWRFFSEGLTRPNESLSLPLTQRVTRGLLEGLERSPGVLFSEIGNIRVRYHDDRSGHVDSRSGDSSASQVAASPMDTSSRIVRSGVRDSVKDGKHDAAELRLRPAAEASGTRPLLHYDPTVGKLTVMRDVYFRSPGGSFEKHDEKAIRRLLDEIGLGIVGPILCIQTRGNLSFLVDVALQGQDFRKRVRNAMGNWNLT